MSDPTGAYSNDTPNRLTQRGSSKNAISISNYAYALGLAGNRTSVAELSGRTVAYGRVPSSVAAR